MTTHDGYTEAAASGDPSSAQATGPLDGIVIVDFSRVLAGPWCTMLLADFGAKVIKIESPAGDDTRQWAPPIANDMSTYFMSANRNKESITLDLKDPADLDTAHAIVECSDVLIENFKPGGLKKFGLDPTQTTKRWPRLIHASINGFGSAHERNQTANATIASVTIS